jgi:hypothetical protein
MNLSTSRKKKKVTRRVDPNAPVWLEINPEFENYSMSKHWAFVWMAANASIKDYKDEAIKYSKKLRKEQMRKFKYSSIQPYNFMTVGKYCHVMNRGGSFDQETIDWLEGKWSELEEVGKTAIEETPIETIKKPVVSIQDRIRDQISEYIGDIEEQVDLFSEGGYKSDFDMYKWLMANNVKSQQANAIGEYYVPWRDELAQITTSKLVHPSSDEQLVEGYSYMKPAQVKKFVEFLSSIINDCDTWSSNQKTVRKTRIKKPASVEKQVARIKYAKENKELKLVSINPALIVGCKQLWVFNTKYRTLQRYDALGPTGLSIKGTSIKGYDEDLSVRKKLRKPEQVLPRLLDGGKLILRKLIDEISSKPSKPNGRINGETILLRVVK